ncbi:MAG: hypothetical protein QXL27_08605 [Candidatus Bathyarchaeia archaeon]
MPTKTLRLIRSIDSGSVVDGSIEELAELAELNKVLLGLLRRVCYDGPLRNREENRYKRYMSGVAEISKALSNLDYALFKFRKPIEHVSVDIDILIRHTHLSKAVKTLVDRGFRIEVLEPYTVTMVRSGSIVDFYTHPAFAWIIYLNGESLLGETELIEINGSEAKALTPEAETIATATHAIYKEHMYLLTDYYVTKKWLNGKALNLARELRAEEAIKTVLRLNEQIERGRIETPVKLKPIQSMEILTRKFMEDSNFRTTTINILKLTAKKRTMQQLIWRIKRRSY